MELLFSVNVQYSGRLERQFPSIPIAGLPTFSIGSGISFNLGLYFELSILLDFDAQARGFWLPRFDATANYAYSMTYPGLTLASPTFSITVNHDLPTSHSVFRAL